MGVYFALSQEKPIKVANLAAAALFQPLPDGSKGRMRKFIESKIQEMLPQPDIGTVQFVARQQLAGMFQDGSFRRDGAVFVWDSEKDFDGWAWADGSEFRKDDFPDAFAVWGQSGADTFKTPVLSSFFQLDPGLGTREAMAEVNYKHPVGLHSHSMQSYAKASSKIILSGALSVLESAGHGDPDSGIDIGGGATIPAFCPGYNPDETVSYYDFSCDDMLKPVQQNISPFAADVRLTENAVFPTKTKNSEGKSQEAYPPYVSVPAMVYIGRKIAGEQLKNGG